jgi:putative flippase GtrA
MHKNNALVIAGIVFTIVSLVHLLRLYFHWEITFAGYIVPMWASIIGFIIPGMLSLWMFRASKR